MYDFGFSNTPFCTPFTVLDQSLAKWFELEDKIRKDRVSFEELNELEDGFLRNCLQMLYIYNQYKTDVNVQEVLNLIGLLPQNDFKIAAIEFLTRQTKYREHIQLSLQEEEYFSYFWNDFQAEPKQLNNSLFSEILAILSTLHYKKTLVYKDSWKKHGEVLGVFANISRKYDRIESLLVDKVRATNDESIVDTIADLAVYAVKYLTYLAEHYSPLFLGFASSYCSVEPIHLYTDNINGFDHVSIILKRAFSSSEKWMAISTGIECHEIIKESYGELENILIHGDWRVDDIRKCTSALNLAISSICYLSLLSQEETEQFKRFIRFVEEL